MKNTPFAFGQMITPVYDVIGNYLIESGVTQLCVDEATLQLLAPHHRKVDWSSWKKGPWVCSKGRNDLFRVSKTYHGWRAYRRIPDKNGRHGPRHVLAIEFPRVPVLFPTAETAMAAVEVFSTDRHWKIAPLGWQFSNSGEVLWMNLSIGACVSLMVSPVD
jgi:hypothetical protein